MQKNTKEKFDRVLRSNTYYFYNQEFEDKFEAGHIEPLREILKNFRLNIEGKSSDDVKKEAEKVLLKGEPGLRALLALTGLSNEMLKRIVTLAQVVKDERFCELIKKQEWAPDLLVENDDFSNFSEWGNNRVINQIRDNPSFRSGIVNVLAEGSTVPFLKKTLPPFESCKLRLGKLSFDVDEMIDTILRYKEKGGYSGKPQNNAETAIARVIKDAKLPYTNGDLPRIKKNSPDKKRTMDFIIPNKENPKVVIESSYQTTTSSGQGDKAKTEIGMRDLLREHYETCLFWGFVDGAGWFVRQGDLERMTEAYDDVFTLAPEELQRFSVLLKEHVRL